MDFGGRGFMLHLHTERDPIAMVFEDLQWADTALLDYIEYLIEWSMGHPIFILTLSRPEFALFDGGRVLYGVAV